jgi:hypothetical protein
VQPTDRPDTVSKALYATRGDRKADILLGDTGRAGLREPLIPPEDGSIKWKAMICNTINHKGGHIRQSYQTEELLPNRSLLRFEP